MKKKELAKEKKRRLKAFRKSGANESQVASWLRGWNQIDTRKKK